MNTRRGAVGRAAPATRQEETMHASHEPTIPTNETDPVRKSRPAGDEDLDYEEPQEAEEPEEEPPPTEYPGGGDGAELPVPGAPGT
jgi:hypothetical protein